MKFEKKDIENHMLHLTVHVDKAEFDDARKEAYMNHTDVYPVMGIASGLATLPDLERVYGPAVLFDEALSAVIPERFNTYLKESGSRIYGRPQVVDVQFAPEGGVSFQIHAQLFPEVKLGQYQGLAVPYDRKGQQMEFEEAVLQRVCEGMKAELPDAMIDDKIETILAQEKLSILQDAVYDLLADILVILDEGYVAAGVSRPKTQVRREATDLMLQTASAEHEMDWKAFLKEQISVMAERYHSLPNDFEKTIDEIIEKRLAAKKKQTPEEHTEELFKAYLGSLELTEEQWKNQRRSQATREVLRDLLLDAVSKKEGLVVTQDEVHHFIEEIADQYGVEPEEAEANIDRAALVWKLKRDKALRIILDSAVTDEKGKAALDKKRQEEKAHLEKEVEIRNSI
ncbi:MAG TPA: hypothetical protein DIW34_01435 [Oribacterium sp.]|nr:hypothetical protein [Oribacterium sp.]